MIARQHSWIRMLVFLLLAVAVALPEAAPRSAAAQTSERCFPETGYCISGRIREYWEQNGGLPVFGFPITPQQEELVEGVPRQVQWFERNRFELHPENQPPYDVLLGRLGADRLAQQGRDWFTFPKGTEQPGCRYFAETQHTVCGEFLAYFRTHGLNLDSSPAVSEAESLALFGLPLSEATWEVSPTDGQSYLTQHFERARMELHPENPPPFNVLLGLLGSEIRAQANAAPAPQPEPEPAPAPPPPAMQPPEVLESYRQRMPQGFWSVSKDGVRIAATGFEYRDSIGYYDAGDGYKFVTCSVAVHNDGYQGRFDDTVFANSASFSLVDLDNNVYTVHAVTYSLDNYLDGGDVYPGTQVSGVLVFRIRENSAPAILIYDTNLRIDLDLRYPPVTS